MPRIPYLNDASININSDVLHSIKNRRVNGQLLNLDRLLLHSSPVASGWHAMFNELRQHLNLHKTIIEFVTLRIAILNRASYEFSQHYPIALSIGIAEEKIQALQNWQSSVLFSEQERAVLAYVDEMTLSVQVRNETFESLKSWYNDQQIIELTALIAGYNMVSRFLEALEVTIEGESTT